VVGAGRIGRRLACRAAAQIGTGCDANIAQVRQRVENDWRAANRRNAEAAAYQALLDGYTIKIESPGRIEKPQG